VGVIKLKNINGALKKKKKGRVGTSAGGGVGVGGLSWDRKTRGKQ
jgi:hypothetical protein